MQKIRDANITKTSHDGASVAIPKVFVLDNNLLSLEKISVYRDTIDGKDALILIPFNKEKIYENKLTENKSTLNMLDTKIIG